MDFQSMKAVYNKYVGNKKLTRARAIKYYCRYNCCAGDVVSWRKCTCNWCFLYKFRMGREITEKEESLKQKLPILHIKDNKQSKSQGVTN